MTLVASDGSDYGDDTTRPDKVRGTVYSWLGQTTPKEIIWYPIYGGHADYRCVTEIAFPAHRVELGKLIRGRGNDL